MGDVGKLSSCLDRLGGLDLTTLENRKLLQKRIYLLQAFGLDLGYRFGWYIYGPYSPDLTRDAFDLSIQLRHASDTVYKESLTSQERSIIKKFKEFLSSISGTGEPAERLELLASLYFLAKENPSLSKKTDVTSKLAELKAGRFSNSEIAQAMKQLLTYGLIRFRH